MRSLSFEEVVCYRRAMDEGDIWRIALASAAAAVGLSLAHWRNKRYGVLPWKKRIPILVALVAFPVALTLAFAFSY